MRYIDPDGKTEEERLKAVARGYQYVAKNTNPGSGSYGYAGWQKGEPGKPIDCSGLVSEAANYAGVEHLNRGGASSGVKNVMNSSRATDFNNMQVGNLVTFRGEKHIGIVTGDIQYDADGNVSSFSVIHSASSTGPAVSKINVDGTTNGKADGYWSKNLDSGFVYQWDTPEYTLGEVSVNARSDSNSGIQLLQTAQPANPIIRRPEQIKN